MSWEACLAPPPPPRRGRRNRGLRPSSRAVGDAAIEARGALLERRRLGHRDRLGQLADEAEGGHAAGATALDPGQPAAGRRREVLADDDELLAAPQTTTSPGSVR